ncbi:transglycosylase SLT domain-containing protein [Priestia megaterium]|uniref:transglycosylase SLT domain-containing protein n=1 Tax=Priestia megaterium TaxID=1404 RepID=UPI0031FD1ACB
MSFAISMALRHWKPLLIGALFSCGVLFFFFFAAAPPEDQYIGNVQQGVITPLGEQEIPAEYVPIYQAAGKKYNVPWQLIAAIHRVETHFGADLNVSSVGALGHTQFMPKTWVNLTV